jgi:phage shock protein A
MSSMSEKSAFDAFARMEERIETNERQLKASIEIEEEFTGDRLANDFKQLERGAAAGSVDVQLLALKQKMGMISAGSPENKALGSGGTRDEETVHAEIEEPGEKKSL